MLKRIALAPVALAALLAAPALARVEKLIVHGKSLEGNLEGNSPDRTVYIVLPDSYDRAKKQRYPVLYFLHGFTSTADEYMGYIPFDRALQASKLGLIIVVPDSNTRFGGSMYSNSPTSGYWENFITIDLVGYVDGHYRTIARRDSRGLTGHSMGGYGTLKLGMQQPQLFGALYAMNPCCLSPRQAGPVDVKFESLTLDQALKGDAKTLANFATAAAWSPNPNNPPFYSDLATRDGQPVPGVLAQWAANAPTAMVPQYLPALFSMDGIGIDTGDTDFVRADDEAIHASLVKFGVPHDWALYIGDHGNRVPERFGSVVLPFFARHLKGISH